MVTTFVTLARALAIGIPLFVFIVGIIALWRSKRYSPRTLSDDFKPHCSVILPCKGTPRDFKKNISSFLDLDYPTYDLYIVVESEEDSAVPIIRDVIKDVDTAHLIIAGLTTSCGQKNHNLVEAVKSIDSTDILIFADSDIALSPIWIQSLIAPLQNDSVKVTTGFRWLVPSRVSLGALGHSYQNLILYLFFSVSSWLVNTGVWGGSMAMRKTVYEDLDIATIWGKTSVDDMSLSEVLKKKKAHTELVYTAVTHTEDTIESIPSMMRWFERQVMYLKAHQKIEWIATLSYALAGGVMYSLGLLGIIITLMGNSTGLSLVYSFIGFSLSLSLVSLIAPTLDKMKHTLAFVLATPFSFLFALIAVLKTLFTNRIFWSGVTYTIRFKDGIVVKVERNN